MADGRRDLSKIASTLERRAYLIVDMLEDQAQRVVDSMDEPPAGMLEPDAEQVRLMWSFSPYPKDPDRTFWQIHDMLLPSLLSQIPPDVPGDQRMQMVRAAHQQAEMQALLKVYPQRAKLAQLGVTTIERSVQLAERAARLVARDQPKPHEMPRVEEVTY